MCATAAQGLRGRRDPPLTVHRRRGTVSTYCRWGSSVMCGRVKWCALALAAGVGVLTAVPALAANWLELNFWLPGPRYDRALPECHAATALNAVAVNFAQKEARFWPQQRGWVYD